MRLTPLLLAPLLFACEQPNVVKNKGDATVVPGSPPGERVTLPPASAPPGAADTGPVVPVPPPSPQPGAIPSAYHGEWNIDPSACGTGLHDSRLVIGPRRLQFYESSGDVRTVRVSGERRITVTSDFSGEGETWTGTDHFLLSPDGDSLTTSGGRGEATVRRRCPAEPKGGAAHSGG